MPGEIDEVMHEHCNPRIMAQESRVPSVLPLSITTMRLAQVSLASVRSILGSSL